MEKNGKLAIEYIAIIILALLLLVVLLIFSNSIRDKILEGMKHFVKNILGR